MAATDWRIRPLRATDDPAVAQVIRTVMPEFGASGAGFAIHDAEVDAMHAAYSGAGAAYFVVERQESVCGGAGIAPLAGGDATTCELRKMYLLPACRGQGAGRALMGQCLEVASALGYRHCYIETLTGMERAQALYLSSGFRRIPQRMGATGHFGCNLFFLRDLGADG
ncbi:MAG TPA: GNAT family N-acetyltransferase [Rhodanobacteraceae bacterium]|nr:GNAT family N-acetyltransferase [Rhodanobacteraceae bacterium]